LYQKIFLQRVICPLKFLITLNTTIHLKRTNVLKGTATLLPASKSINNRALIINALAGSKSEIQNMSDANDVQLMLRLVNSTEEIIDVEDAGTTMRFLTAYFAVTNQHKVLTGTSRMKERPIGILVNALRSLGADIEYMEKDGYPPLKLNGFSGQKADTIRIRGDVSSQFISALMMVAPVLPNGLTLELEGKIGSRPYIEMTASIMKHFGASSEFISNKVIVPHQQYTPAPFTVESDWSGASYWFAFTALAEKAEIYLPKLSLQSLQGDSVIVKIMDRLGVHAAMENGLLKLTKKESQKELHWDFTHCPDLGQTVAVVCAAKGIKGYFTGLESLRIKETDRIAALQNELQKIGGKLVEEDTENWTLIPSTHLPSQVYFNTYKDHRMAMAFAPLATLMNVEIERPEVVKKSYPNFWNDLKEFGLV
jgi:3-phosphoshikimate 1-carboxyvinyltransferase